MIASLVDILDGIAEGPTALPHFNVWGYEDALAVCQAGEAVAAPFCFGINKTSANFMGLDLLVPMLRTLAEQTNVAVAVHLDHYSNFEILQRAIDLGCTSIMYDGSQLPLDQNIANTQCVVEMARKSQVSVEGEVGSVPYSDQPG